MFVLEVNIIGVLVLIIIFVFFDFEKNIKVLYNMLLFLIFGVNNILVFFVIGWFIFLCLVVFKDIVLLIVKGLLII